ncbi:S-layer homology domain-containing protein [Lysinibacillus sp. KU-BSD001]|uniref:S-layer homology domain-containing protein n=1 Tax=Lysinibacillus sp. KU-BSD001 TaxID=3141328 RepID=UPI0036EB7CE5
MFKKTIFTSTLAATMLLTSVSGTMASAQSQEAFSTPPIINSSTVAQTEHTSFEELYKMFNLNELIFDAKHYSVTAVSNTQFVLKISVDAIVQSYEDNVNAYEEGKEEFMGDVALIRSTFGNHIEMRFTKQRSGIQKEIKVTKQWLPLSAEDEAVFLEVLGRGDDLQRDGGYFLDTLNHWAEPYVQFLYELDIINGQNATTFNPNGHITRAQLVSMVFRATGLSAKEDFTSYAPYKDLTNHWAAKEIAILYDYGFLDIFGEGTFIPSQRATREEVAYMTHMLLLAYGVDDDFGYNTTFKDQKSINPLALDSISYLQKLSIINGYKDGTFKPKSMITRAQFAKVLTLATFHLEEYYEETELD